MIQRWLQRRYGAVQKSCLCTLFLFATCQIVITTTVLRAEESYPSRPILMVVPWPAGGATDGNARLYAQSMSKTLGQPIVVENRPGAGGSIGAGAVARSGSDGYTIAYIASSNAITSLSIKRPTYGIGADLTPVALTANEPLLLLVNAKRGFKDIHSLVEYARSLPSGVDYASTGAGSLLHIVAANFLATFGIEGQSVPYKGTAPAITDLVGGQITMFFGTFSDAYGLVQGGQLQALAITSADRSPLLPNVPTMSEAIGRADPERGTWQGIVVPKGTLTERIRLAIGHAGQDQYLSERLLSKGITPLVGSPMEFDAVISAELERRGKQLRDLAITTNR
jgi:tripartite-type tricarboxylate transporter receptor subunit TctC